MSEEENKSKPLLFSMLLACNFASGSTTVLGCIQIFPKPIFGGVAGIVVQSLLFLLTSGRGVKDAPCIKWFSASFLASVSIYTSFFGYHHQLTNEKQKALAKNMASAAHYRLVEKVFTPIESALQESKSKYLNKNEQARQEEERGLYSPYPGYGPITRKLKQEAIDLESSYIELKRIVDRIRPNFERDISDLSAEEILEHNRHALASVPLELRPHDLKSQDDLVRSDYFDEEQDISLLAPYYKIRNHEEAAIISMILAAGFDSVILILGLALSTRQNKSFRDIVTSLITETKKMLIEVRHVWLEPVDIHPTSNQKEILDEVLEAVKNSGILVTEFLGALIQMVDEDAYVINIPYKKGEFMDDPMARRLTETYKLLFNTMYSTLGWLERDDSGMWRIKDETSYKCLMTWLREEIQRASREEPRISSSSTTKRPIELVWGDN